MSASIEDGGDASFPSRPLLRVSNTRGSAPVPTAIPERGCLLAPPQLAPPFRRRERAKEANGFLPSRQPVPAHPPRYGLGGCRSYCHCAVDIRRRVPVAVWVRARTDVVEVTAIPLSPSLRLCPGLLRLLHRPHLIPGAADTPLDLSSSCSAHRRL